MIKKSIATASFQQIRLDYLEMVIQQVLTDQKIKGALEKKCLKWPTTLRINSAKGIMNKGKNEKN